MYRFKQLLAALLLSAGLSAAAAVTADYQFTLVIDENIRDMSGNHRVPECHFGESDFVSGEFDAVRFGKPDHAVKVPFAAFPGVNGSAAMKVNLEKVDGLQVLFRVYNVKSDVLTLMVRDGKLRATYHNRATKKSYHVHGPVLNADMWYDLELSWFSGKKIVLSCNDWQQGRNIAGAKMVFAPESQMIVGNSHDMKAAMQGKLHRFTLTDGKKSKKTAATAPAAIGKVRTFKVGNYTIGVDESGAITRLAARNTEFVAPGGTPLWVINVMDKQSGKFSTVKPGGKPEISNGKNGLVMRWKNVDAAVKAVDNGETLAWTIQASVPRTHVVDTVEYPRLKLQPTCANPAEMRFVYPSYFGCSKSDPFSVKDGKPRAYGNTYGGGAHYQFCFMHAPDKPGLYIETRDGEGNIKEFRFAGNGTGTGIFYLTQMPEQRLQSNSFASAYAVRTAALEGDWFDAAKKYRQWAIKQRWCQNGKLHENKIVPEWLKNCDFAVRIHTWTRPQKPRLASTSAKNAAAFAELLNKPQSLGIWYCLTYIPDFDSVAAAKGEMTCGNARSDSVYAKGAKDAMKVFTASNINVIHYINSRIFDQSLKPDHPETNRIRPLVMRDHKGNLQLYGKMWYEGCRVDARWQDHLLKLIKRDVAEFGFRGTYLDSFGRGQEFCYSDNHDHEPGSCTASINGQRAMATKIKNAMRQRDPGYILCSEASIEQFVDLIDVKLHHYNVFEESVPIWAAIYHDYQLVHGRSMESERQEFNSAESNAALAAGTFHNGAIVGRFFADRTRFTELYYLDMLQSFYMQISSCRQQFRDFLSYGEMLRPPRISGSTAPDVKLIVRKRIFQQPTITASCWKAPDGKVAIIVTNASREKASCQISSRDLKPTEIVRFAADGRSSAAPFAGNKLELEPFSVVVLR